MKRLRAASVLTWIYAAGYGIPAIPVALYLIRNSKLPSLFGLFEVYGGPWSAEVEPATFARLLVAFFGLTGFTAWAAWKVWKRSRAGAVLLLVLLVVNAVFWVGFALPFPWLIAAAVGVLIAIGWKDLSPPERTGSTTTHAHSGANFDGQGSTELD